MRDSRASWARIAVGVALIAAAMIVQPGLLVSGAPVGRQQVKVTLPTASTTFDVQRWEATLVVANAWKSLGMNVEVIPFQDFPSLVARVGGSPNDFDAFVSSFAARPERLDPDALLYVPLHSTGIFNNGPNLFAYSSAEYDRLATAQRRELNVKKRQELVWKAQEILARDAPFITLYYQLGTYPYNTRRFSGMVPMVGRGLWNPWTVLGAQPLGSDRILRLGWVDELDTTNPLSNATAVEPMRLVYDYLARIDSTGQPVPWAAERWRTVTDTSIDVTLRPGMVFHDGRPVTVDDVVFSFDFIKRNATAPYYRAALDPIKGLRALNDRTFRILLNNPYPPLFMITFTQVPILPKHIWENVVARERVDTPAKWANPSPIGSGPFQFVRWQRGEQLVLRRFDKHFNPPKAEELLAVRYSNQDAVFQAVAKGDIDFTTDPISPLQLDAARRTPGLRLVDIADFGVYYLGFNLRRPPFQDQRFRDAIKHTIDWKTIVEAALGGRGVPGTGFIAPVNKFWHNPAWADWLKGDYAFDLTRARQMLQRAGYTWDDQGRMLSP